MQEDFAHPMNFCLDGRRRAIAVKQVVKKSPEILESGFDSHYLLYILIPIGTRRTWDRRACTLQSPASIIAATSRYNIYTYLRTDIQIDPPTRFAPFTPYLTIISD